MGHERWFRGQHEGQKRPFDWLTAARQHGIPHKLAQALYEQAMKQAHGATQDRVQELYLALLTDARRDAARPSPGKVTRTMRLQAERSGKKHCRTNISPVTGQPIAPGKTTLTSYIEPAHGLRNETRVSEELMRLVATASVAAGNPDALDPAAHFQDGADAPDGRLIGRTWAIEEFVSDLDVWQDTRPVPSSLAVHRKARAIQSHQLVAARDLVDLARSGPSEPLPTSIRADLELALGADLSAVRVHRDRAAAEAAEALAADAFAIGPDIFFDAGYYAPDSEDGKRLIAHEVAHTVEQGAVSMGGGAPLELSEPGDAHERRADTFADAFVAGATRNSGEAAGIMPAAGSSPLRISRRRRRSSRPSARELARWARHPSNFIGLWEQLTGDEQSVVIEAMDAYYDRDFTDAFYTYADTGTLVRQFQITPYTDHSPNGWPTAPPAEHGYRLLERYANGTELWVHPSGAEIQLMHPRHEPEAEDTELLQPPDRISLPDNLSSVFGTRRGQGHNVSSPVGSRVERAELYQDGTIVTYQRSEEGRERRTVYRPIPGLPEGSAPGYYVYDDDGRYSSMVYVIADGPTPEEAILSASGSGRRSSSPVQRKARSGGDAAPGSNVDVVARGGFAGTSVPVPYRTEMELAFGTSFADVRAHIAEEAQSACIELGASGYALGTDVAFAMTDPPRELVAHELAHVIQQRHGRARTAAGDGPVLEREADRVAADVVAGHSVRVMGTVGMRVARSPASAYANYGFARVRHPRHGEGRVVQPPRDSMLVVRFDGQRHNRRVPEAECEILVTEYRDPEQVDVAGRLPFTGPEHWNSEDILNALTQLDNDLITRTDAVRCNAQAVLGAHIAAGPQAVLRVASRVRTQMQEQITRLEASRPREARLVESADERLLNHLHRLQPGIAAFPERLRAHLTTYPELQQLAEAMMVLSVPDSLGANPQGTDRFIGMNFDAYNQGRSADSMAVPGEYTGITPFEAIVARITGHPGVAVVLGVNVLPDDGSEAQAPVNHAITVGCDQQGAIYVFDPRPRTGAQRLRWPQDRASIIPYFVSDHEGHGPRRWIVANRVSSYVP